MQGTNVSSLEGYVEVESDQPISGWGCQINNPTDDPAFIVAKGHGYSRLLIPSATNAHGFISSLVVVNTSSDGAFVDIVLRDSNGQVRGQLTNIVIPAKGTFNSPDIVESLGSTESLGSVEIISNNGHHSWPHPEFRALQEGGPFRGWDFSKVLDGVTV